MDGDYGLPVSKLLWIGQPGNKWQNYAALGLTAEHIPDLFRMVREPWLQDEESNLPKVWAPAHAWRALTELNAPGLIDAMLSLLDTFDDDWWDDQFLADFPAVASRLGPSVLPALREYIRDPQKLGQNRALAADAIATVAQAHPEVRRTAIATFEQLLAQQAENPTEVNSTAIVGLVGLGSRDSISLIRDTMHSGRVDEMATDRLEQIEFALGYRDRPPERRPWRIVRSDDEDTRPDDWGANEWRSTPPPLGAPAESEDRAKANARERARARRKQAKAARKRNRLNK